MHMTNNRLHVTIRDEAYLAHLLGRVLRESQSQSQSESEGAGAAEGAAVAP